MIIKTKRNIRCIWDGTLAGIVLTNDAATTGQTTTKMIGIHGWLDNLNSILPLSEKLINRHPNYEIFLYDRAGHGFSSHLPKGFDYSVAHDLQDLRVVIQTLGWNKEQMTIIGHSYGGALGTIYAATYPDDVLCLVAVDALPRPMTSIENFFKVHAARIEASLLFYNSPSRTPDNDLTLEEVIDLTISTRDGITKQAAKILSERLVRPDEDNNLYFTRDESVRLETLIPFTDEIVRSAILSVKACVLFVGTTEPQWPRDPRPYDLFKEHNPTFEMTLFNAPHHLHMTNVDQVADRIEEYFRKHLPQLSL